MTGTLLALPCLAMARDEADSWKAGWNPLLEDRARAPSSLTELLDRIEEASKESDPVSLGFILQAAGGRSFGPVLPVAGLVMVAPIVGDIPGVPVLMGLIVALTAGQMLFHRKHAWLPRFLLKRAVARSKIEKGLSWVRRPARFVDRWTHPRMLKLSQGAATNVIAAACLVIGILTPVMEVVPMSANVAGLAVLAFGLALIVHDGLVALLALSFTVATVGLLGYSMLS